MGSSERRYDESQLWARSGAMALTGRAVGPPLPCAGSPASAVRAELDRLAELGVSRLPGVELLGERAAYTGNRRNAPFSVGGSFRILPAMDGWVGLSLARPSDVEQLSALIEAPVTDEPWRAVARWLGSRTAAEAVERIVILGMAGAAVPDTEIAPRRPGVLTTPGGPRVRSAAPVVVDLTSLWAGPLCAHVLGMAGARVIKVESHRRPDASRNGTPEFFDLLHAGHESVVLDFAADRTVVKRLVAQADVILEASRPRALRQLGIDADAEAARGAIWVSITAYGRGGDEEMRIGFGDDIAAGAGLLAWDCDEPLPAGDALADPLAGITAAAAVVAALRRPTGCLLDVSMHDIAVAARAEADSGRGEASAVAPQRRSASGNAAPFGRDTERIRSEFGA